MIPTLYQVPLKFVEVSPELALCATRIIAIMSTQSYQARETIKAERKAGTLINGSGNRAAESCVFLDNGSVVSSPYTIKHILRCIENSDEKGTHKRGPSQTNKIKLAEANLDELLPFEELAEDDLNDYNTGDFDGDDTDIDEEGLVDK